ncbi:unnamed protein product [Trifolium pratense]|uniref:Uncharacterized protein n=1 Tax=Trifolium pratense TaxID=57577 RepID=A0ACB0KRI7_TRIPR|nr:unnamed protein product [Trifolium pratense]
MLVILPWKLLGIQHYFMTGWVNRFANAGDTAMEIAGNTALRVSYDFKTLFLSVVSRYFLRLSHWNLYFISYVIWSLDTSKLLKHR